MKVFILIISMTYAFEELELSVKKAILLQEPNFKVLDILNQLQKSSAPPNPFSLYESPVEDQPVLTLLIKKGKVLKNPTDNKRKILSRDIFAKAKFMKKSGKYMVYDRFGKAVWELSRHDGIIVDESVDLDVIPKKYLTYEPSKLNNPYDKKISLTHSFSLNKETIDASYFSQFFDTPADQADGLKIDYKLFHKTTFPISFGLVGSLERGNFTGWAVYGFFLGAGIKSPLRLSPSFVLEGHLIFERSLYLNVNSTSFEMYCLQGNLEVIFKDRFFLNFSYMGGSISANNQWIQTSADSNRIYSLGLGIGIKFYSDIKL